MIETIPPGMYGSIVYIIATEDNTVIDITPSAATSGGWGANTLHTITLNTGQGYLFNTNSASASLAGTVIQLTTASGLPSLLVAGVLKPPQAANTATMFTNL